MGRRVSGDLCFLAHFPSWQLPPVGRSLAFGRGEQNGWGREAPRDPRGGKAKIHTHACVAGSVSWHWVPAGRDGLGVGKR